MSEAEEATKKRLREEEEPSEAAASSEPPLKQSKGDPTAPEETPNQWDENAITDPGADYKNEEGVIQPEQSDSNNTETGTKNDEPAEQGKTEAPEPASSLAQDTSTLETAHKETEETTNQDTVVPQDTSQTTLQDMGKKTDQGEATTVVPPAEAETGEEKVETPAVEETPRPGDPVAAAAQAAGEVSQSSDIVAGMTPAVEVPTSVGAAPPAMVASPDKLAPPPEALVNLQDEVVEEKGEISAVIAGRVIGKGGEVIRDLQARSGASIDVDAAPSGNHRIVTYRGPRRKVEFAKQLVDMISRGMSDSDLPLGEATREVLLIPASATGKVIGRGGEMVREMQTRSQAKIDFDHAATANRPDQKQVVVTGTHDAVRKANEMIMFLVANPQLEAMQALNLLVNEKLASGQPWGSGPPYPSLPNAGSNMQPEMLGSYGSPGGYGPDAQYATAPPSHSSYGRPPDPRMGGAGPGMAEDMFYAKKQFMGRIIGQRGVTINDLQKRSGADIQINQDVPPGAECEIRIRGTRDGIEMVKHMLRQIIEIGPGHPYAGGAGGGGPPGGHGGHYGGGYGGGAQYQGGGGQGYDYGGQQSYGYPPQQQSQVGYGYPPQQPAGGYAGAPPGAAPYQNYGPGQDYGAGGGGGGGYGGAPPPYGGGGGPPSYNAGGGYPPQSSSYQSGYGQQGGGYPPQQSGPPQQAYGGGGSYGQAPPPSYPPAPAAASGWKAATSPDGQIYYYNESTGATQWDKPPGFA